MTQRLRNTTVRAILTAYVLSGVLLEVAHRDIHDFVLNTTPTLSNHECGANEIHIPLDKRHDCLACAQSTQRLAFSATKVPAAALQFECHVRLPVCAERTLQTDFLHTGKRGPPLLSL